MPGGKGGAQRIDPFTGADYANLLGPLLGEVTGRDEVQVPGKGGAQRVGQIPGVDIGRTQKQIASRDPLESSAAGVLQGAQGGQSFLQGGQGALGRAGGLFGQAQQAATAGPVDVLNDPQTQALLQAQAGGVQSLLNRNLSDIGASAQRASGGIGSGSGETAAKTRAVTQAAGALANQQAQTLFGERARLENQGLQRAGLLGQLGSGFGQLGLGQAGLGSQLLGQQIGLGGQFQGRETAASLFPLEQLFRLGELLKSTSGVRQPGFLEQLGSLGSAAGGAALGFRAFGG